MNTQGDNLGWALYILITVTGMIIAIGLIGWRKCTMLRFFAPLFLGFMGMTYVVRPPISYLFGDGYTYAQIYNIPVERLPLVAMAIAVSFISFAYGYRVHSPQDYANAAHWTKQSSLLLRVMAMLMVATGYAVLIALGGKILGAQALETMAGGTINTAGTSFIGLSVLFVPAGLILLASSGASWTVVVGLGLPFIVTAILEAYNRYTFLTFICALAIVALIRNPRFRVTAHLGLAGVISIVFISFLVIGADRVSFSATRDISANVEALQTGGVDRLIGDFAGFEGTCYAVNRVAEVRETYGARNFYSLFILPIPRFIWPGKPLPPEFTWEYLFTGELLEGYRSEDFDLFSNTQVKGHVGYAMEDWGWAGPIVTFFLTGMLYGWIEKKFWQSNGNPTAIAAYAVAYSLLLYSGRNMVTDNLIRFIVFYFVPYGLLWLISPELKAGKLDRFPSRPFVEKNAATR